MNNPAIPACAIVCFGLAIGALAVVAITAAYPGTGSPIHSLSRAVSAGCALVGIVFLIAAGVPGTWALFMEAIQ